MSLVLTTSDPDCLKRVELTEVRRGTPAEKAGLQTGDVITAIDGTEVTNASPLSAAIEAKSPATR